jgi:hypothetical protein
LWLADGFHRWHAHKALRVGDIEANIYDGSRRDALLYSLSANASHGLQRKQGDYKRAYEIACRNKLVDPADAEAVATLLRCTGRWGEILTHDTRNAAKAARDATIVAGKEAGKTVRQIAKETGASIGTVYGVQKANTSENEHSDPDEDDTPTQPSPTPRPEWAQKLDEPETPAAKNWSSALKALRAINEQVSVDTLFDERFIGFDQVFGPELERAFAWINQLHRRFESGQATRRRA